MLKYMVLLLTVSLMSCAPIMALHGSSPNEVVMRDGLEVTCVGDEPSPLRATIWGASDILTGFTAEIVGTPVELYLETQEVCTPVPIIGNDNVEN